jgi:hypothetical protein
MLNGCTQFNILFLNSVKLFIGKEKAFLTYGFFAPYGFLKSRRHHHTLLLHLHQDRQSQGL